MGKSVLPGYASHGRGVGEFENTRLLERAVQMPDVLWTTAQTANQNIVLVDVDKFLREYHRNADILKQFRFYKADIEVEFKLNTNQFYYGMLQATLFHGQAPGIEGVDARAVLDPTLISAQVGDSAQKEWKYSWPHMWKPLQDTVALTRDSLPVFFYVDVLAPLKTAKQDMEDNITLKMWARFKNIKLCYPFMDVTPAKGKERLTVQSGEGSSFPTVKKPKKNKGTHPDDTPGHRTVSTVDTAVEAFSNITIGDAFSKVSGMFEGAGALSYFLDKPDVLDSQDTINKEASIDLFNADRPDTNVSVSLCRGRYVDPGPGRMPMSKDWSMSEYAQIPGLRDTVKYFAAKGNQFTYDLIQTHGTNNTMRTPLDYCYLSSKFWRGSIKVMLHFVTSSFVSARFVVQFINNVLYPGAYADPYDCGVAKVINVKGDTMVGITLPWMDLHWWSENRAPQIRVTCDSTIATSDTIQDPQIGLLVFVAGGDDIQFAWPRIIQYGEWGNASGLTEKLDVQTSVGGMFNDKSFFPSIIENGFEARDEGWCTGEQIGSLAELAKRYANIPNTNGAGGTSSWYISGMRWGAIDSNPLIANSAGYWEYLRFRKSFFGQVRSMFFHRSGGYRWRHYSPVAGAKYVWAITDVDGGTVPFGTFYETGDDGVSRLTIPQIMSWPFEYLRNFSPLAPPSHGLTVAAGTLTGPPSNDQNLVYIAARDDIQLGFPILPRRLSQPTALEDEDERRAARKLERGTARKARALTIQED